MYFYCWLGTRNIENKLERDLSECPVYSVRCFCAAGLVAISETAFSQPQKPDPAGIIRLFSTGCG